MKLKVQSVGLALIASTVLTPTIQAQTDITDQYLTNPDFEYVREGELYVNSPEYAANKAPVRGDPYGWTRQGEILGNSLGINADGLDYTGEALCWYNSSPMPDFFEVSQTIEGLPAGDYLVTCKLAIFADRKSNQRLFANQNVQYFVDEATAANMPKVEGEINSYAGLIATPSGLALLQNMVVMTTLQEGEPLKLGIRSSNLREDGEREANTNFGWFKMDDFKLYYLEGGIIGYTRMQLEQSIGKINGLDPETLPLGDYNSLLAAKDAAQILLDESEDPDALSEALAGLEERFKTVERAMTSWITLNDLLTLDYPELVALGYAGLPEFETAFENALNLTNDPEATWEDFDKEAANFRSAIEAYKYTGFEQAALHNPFDANWYLKDPSFDNIAESTTLDLFWAQTTGDLYKLTKNFVEVWADGRAGLTLPNSSAYQVIKGLPNGIYDLEASMIACNQGYDAPSDFLIEGVYLMGNTTLTPVSTQQDPETYNQGSSFKVRVIVTNGELVAGAKVYASNASWVGIDDLKLTYYGNKDLPTYQAAYTDQIGKARALLGRDALPIELNALERVIKEAEAADRSTVENLEAVLDKLSAAMTTLEIAEKQQTAFKAASYQKALIIANNDEGIYASDIVGLMTNVLVSVNELLFSDTTTVAAYPVLTADLDAYISFVDAYNALNEYKMVITENDLGELIEAVLSAQILEVSADKDRIEDSKNIFASIRSFAKTYEVAVTCIYSGQYPEPAVAQLMEIMTQQLTETKADATKAPEAEKNILEALGAMRFEGLQAGEDTDVTELTIVNPGLNTLANGEVPEGWTMNRGNGNEYCNNVAHWSGEENWYINSWSGSFLRFTANQEIKGIPNGTYKLVAAARSWGAGSYLYAASNGVVFKTPINTKGDGGGTIWEQAEEGTPIKEAHGGVGYGWDWITVEHINVSNHVLTIGCTSDDAVSGGTGSNVQWYSVDDFKLYYVSESFDSGLDQVQVSQDELIVYTENGCIQVVGEETFTVTTLSGVQVSASAQLAPGIYLVKAGSKSAKVLVK